MEQLAAIWQWIVETQLWEWVFSGIGVSAVGWLLFRKKPDSKTFTCNGGDQNVGQGDGAVGKQANKKRRSRKAAPPCHH